MSDMLREIVQGNTGTLYKIGVKGCPDLTEGGPDYTCHIEVASAVPPITRTITDLLDGNTRFAVQLTPAETELCAACEKHILAVEIRNNTLIPAFKVETLLEFWVNEQVIA